MHLPTSAGARRRTRRALLAAALPAVLAVVALPTAAQAGVASIARGELLYNDGLSENNRVTLRKVGSDIFITDEAGGVIAGDGCRLFIPTEAVCPAAVITQAVVLAGGGADTVEYRLPHPGSVDLGSGEDTLVAGTREPAGFTIQPATYNGGSGHDTITYFKAGGGVSLTPEDNLANDGKPGSRDNVRPDFETFVGSRFRDAPLFGTPNADVMIGGGGDDQLGGGGGGDRFLAIPGDGTDDYHGGPGRDTIDYSGHTRPVLVDLDNVADDSELGENDNVRSNVENVVGGAGDDSIKSLGAHSTLDGRGGDDHLVGGFGPDTLIGGSDVDRIEGGTESDVIISADGNQDTVICGDGVDSVTADLSSPTDLMTGCETVPVGKLRLAPKAVATRAGKPAQVRLSWRHPRAWRRVRSIELRLYRDGAPVGEVTIRPRRERISADGAVELVRKQTRLARKGKTVTARLAVRLDKGLAGQTLTAEVEATDMRGARQLERDAGTVRVAS